MFSRPRTPVCVTLAYINLWLALKISCLRISTTLFSKYTKGRCRSSRRELWARGKSSIQELLFGSEAVKGQAKPSVSDKLLSA